MGINKEIDAVLKVYKELSYNSKKNELNGVIKLDSGDAYNVRIDLSLYPKLFPSVYEIDERIPRKVERHIYTGIGACCFTTGAKSQVLLKTKVNSLLVFMDEIVVRYFENNSYYEINGHYFDQEYAHGSLGIIEGYKDILGMGSIDAIGYLIVERLNNKLILESDLCYCNSKIQLGKCKNGKHLNNYNNFLLIDKPVLRNNLDHFKNLMDR